MNLQRNGAKSNESIEAFPSRAVKILILEGDPLIRMTVSEHFRNSGFDVVEADSTSGAVAAIESTPDIDCVFTDIRMAGPRDGLELARWIIQHRPGLVFLGTSGDSDPAHREDGNSSQAPLVLHSSRLAAITSWLGQLVEPGDPEHRGSAVGPAKRIH